jgi:hypothetical protein
MKQFFRAKLFAEISQNDYISLEQWISWAVDHIAGKESTMVKVSK